MKSLVKRDSPHNPVIILNDIFKVNYSFSISGHIMASLVCHIKEEGHTILLIGTNVMVYCRYKYCHK